MADCSSKFSSIKHIALGDTVYLQSLEDLSIIKVVLALRKSEDPKIRHFPTLCESLDPLRELNEKIYKKLLRLDLPENLTSRIFYSIDETLKYVQDWFCLGNMFNIFGSGKSAVPDLVWTSQGTVHEQKTALIITQREDVNLMVRYKIAFAFNLEEQLFILREKLRNDPQYCNDHVESSIMVVGPIIPYYYELNSVFLQGLAPFLRRENLFVLEKLSADPKNRENVLLQFIQKPDSWSYGTKFTALHFISIMNPTEKKLVIQDYARYILDCYYKGLPHPRWRYLFFETVKFLIPFMTKSDICYFMHSICLEIRYIEKYPIEFKIILTEFLNLIIKSGKTDFGEEIFKDLRYLIEAGDAKHIIMILKESDSEARKSFFTYLSGHVFRYQDLGFFEFLIQNCELTNFEVEDMLQSIGGEDFDDLVGSFCRRLGFSDCDKFNQYNKITSEDKVKVMELLKNIITDYC